MNRIKSPEHREQLLKLARLANFLDDLPHDRFHMPTWTAKDATEDSCGTAGCAGGWAATIFREQGWRIQYGIPTLGGLSPSVSFGLFFGIHHDDARFITTHLSPTNCADDIDLPTYTREYRLRNPEHITPRHAADRIRKVLKWYDPTLLDERTKPPMPVEVLACQTR